MTAYRLRIGEVLKPSAEDIAAIAAAFGTAHDAIPDGVPGGYSWREQSVLVREQPPTGFLAYLVWNQAFWINDGPFQTHALEVRALSAFFCLDILGTPTWVRVQIPQGITGADYLADFTGGNVPFLEEREIVTGHFRIRWGGDNRAAHFWPDTRHELTSYEILSILTYSQFRAVNNSGAPLTTGVTPTILYGHGYDYWTEVSGGNNVGGDGANGRLKYAREYWQWHGLTTASEAELNQFLVEGFIELEDIPSTDGSWESRISQPGVIAWNGFEFDEEVTAFANLQDTSINSVALYRETDPVIGNCLVFKFLGALLAADFLAAGGNGPRTMVLDDASDWPDPAVDGSFQFAVSRVPLADAPERFKTIFECTARTGNNLTVTYVPTGGAEFEDGASFQDRFIGDAAGSECQNYERLFSPMSGEDNGKGEDDPGANGTIPVRSRIVENPAYVPQAPSIFGYGFCAHEDYETDDRFEPWTPNYQGLGQGDSVERTGVIDTNEIYIQIRLWIDENTQLEDMQGGKQIGFQTETTVPQQLVTGIAPGGTSFNIPSTPEAPFVMSKFNYASYGSAGMRVMTDPYETSVVAADYCYQPGSPWEETALHYISNQPSTGQDTPDGNSAFEYKYGRWCTWLYRLKPGKDWHYTVPVEEAWDSATENTITLLDEPTDWPTGAFQISMELTDGIFDVTSRTGRVLNGVTLASGSHVSLSALDNNWICTHPKTPAQGDALTSEIEVKFADFEDTEYTTILSVANYPLIYGSRGQTPHAFDQCIPGFNALVLWGYRNTELSSTMPFKTYYQKVGQIIISKNPIAVPVD